MYTPWGLADSTIVIAPGLINVTTPSHGGIYVDPERRGRMPEYLAGEPATDGGAWYEEDCHWCFPAVVFEAEFRAWIARSGQDPDKFVQSARDTMRNWYPHEYQRHYQVTLQPGESQEFDRERFVAAHAGDWLVTAAWGSWHSQVPDGYVGVCAVKGAELGSYQARHSWFLVDSDEYDTRGATPYFVIDPARHTSFAPIQ